MACPKLEPSKTSGRIWKYSFAESLLGSKSIIIVKQYSRFYENHYRSGFIKKRLFSVHRVAVNASITKY